jgi:hypothetical protein
MGPDRAVEDARVDVSWPLVGRSAELAALTATIADAHPGGMVLAGAVRVGKTRLAREAVDRTAAGRAVAWVAATQAAASIPFGAVSHLLPATERFGADRLETLRRAADLLAEQQRGRLLVLGVDDAHLLDDASAALVHLLVLRGLVDRGQPVAAAAAAPPRDDCRHQQTRHVPQAFQSIQPRRWNHLDRYGTVDATTPITGVDVPEGHRGEA